VVEDIPRHKTDAQLRTTAGQLRNLIEQRFPDDSPARRLEE
jgi:hypothetical protein